MKYILAHIVGMDELHKRQLAKDLLECDISYVDLDAVQQSIYNCPEIRSLKTEWEELGKKIIEHTREKPYKTVKGKIRLEKVIDGLRKRKTNINKEIHNIWRDMFDNLTTTQIGNTVHNYVVLLGYNVFPKDFRIKILFEDTIPKINYILESEAYAKNQIKFYVKKYEHKIVDGTFNLKLLDVKYLTTRYDKLSKFYTQLNYNHVVHGVTNLVDQLYGWMHDHVRTQNPINIELVPSSTSKPVSKIELLSQFGGAVSENVPTVKTIIPVPVEDIIISTEVKPAQKTTVNSDIMNLLKTTTDLTDDTYAYVALPYKLNNAINVQKEKSQMVFLNKTDAISYVRRMTKSTSLIYVYKINRSHISKKPDGEYYISKRTPFVDCESAI
jgi:hypothetical protein